MAAVAVRFLTGMSPYNAGEVAGFAPARAAALVAGGVAEYVQPPSPPDAPPDTDALAPSAEPEPKAPDAPPDDRMVRGRGAIRK